MMPYDSLVVASFIAQRCKEKGFYYNNTKIQKLLYCCYGSVLAVYGERLCSEYPRAWQYGPVFPRVFNYIQKRKGNLEEYCLAFQASQEIIDLLDSVIDVFGRQTAVRLSDWTHQPGSPWDKVVNKINGEGQGMNDFIPDDIITKYFKEHVVNVGQAS